MTDIVKPGSVTSDYLIDLAGRINSVGSNPVETVFGGRAKLIAELDGYIASPDCFSNHEAKAFAEETRRRIV